ncbi:MAG: PBSX family phage terminase large subunit [Clostridia bacterium]|nr:PBSX family phage terminase large subunit [Clostridia bacterium]
MTFEKISIKQKRVLTWCHQKNNPYSAIICDGAVRSGKTSIMIVSFILWAMRYYNDTDFAICGKTVRSTERNIITPLQSATDITEYYNVTYTRSINVVTISGQGKVNRFYVFGGRDESSAALIQGITLSGILLDEVVLMPRSFVEQAVARTLSVKGSKIWFNCNPGSPNHWFFEEWIKKAEEKKALHLHFLMNDNPIMTEEAIERAESLYQGVFYDRFIKGLWVQAEGLIYPAQAQGKNIVPTIDRKYTTFYVSIDYGTVNPFSMGLWGYCEADKTWYRVKEYYFNSRKEGFQKTDNEYLNEYFKFTRNLKIKAVVVDPSAASFITLLKRNHIYVIPAQNSVVEGIRVTANLLSKGQIKINDCCRDCISEFSLYHWDEKAAEDRPAKEHDHAMDDIRYFALTILDKPVVTIKTKPSVF